MKRELANRPSRVQPGDKTNTDSLRVGTLQASSRSLNDQNEASEKSGTLSLQ